MNTIQSNWESFRNKVVPINAPKVQIDEMEKAFFAGAFALLNITDVIGSSETSEDAGVAIFKGLHDEVNCFVQKQSTR